MKPVKYCLLLFIVFSFIASCKKKEHDHGSNKVPPVVTVTSPTEGAVFNTADSIHFIGYATDDADLHSGRLSIVRKLDDYILLAKSLYAHQYKEYFVDDKLKVEVTAVTEAKAIVQFEDHDGNVTTKEVNITINP
jgi:hypothetical protein